MEVGILSEKIEQLEKRVDTIETRQEDYIGKLNAIQDGVTRIETMLESRKEVERVQNELNDSNSQNLEKRVEKLESNQKWFITAILGEVIAIISAIVKVFINRGI